MKYLFGIFFLLGIVLSLSNCRSSNPELGESKLDTSVSERGSGIWQADAGVVKPFTDMSGVSAQASSGSAIGVVLDHDLHTAWQSEAPYPTGYVTRKDQNILLDAASQGKCSGTTSDNLSAITDGNLSNSVGVNVEAGKSRITCLLNPPKPIYAVSLKLSTDQPLQLNAISESGQIMPIATLTPSDNFNFQRYTPNLSQPIARLELVGNAAFSLFEIAALSAPAKEFVTIKLPQAQSIGVINTRHFTADSNAVSCQLLVSSDSINFTQVAALSPSAVPSVPTWVNPPKMAKYIRIQYTIKNKDWAKASFWEIDAYNANGLYGEAPPAVAQTNTISEILGINGIWGWGTAEGSAHWTTDTKGAQLYAKVASHARNYHEMDWDVADPDITPVFDTESGNSTSTQPWLNWDTEYGKWVSSGMSLEISVKCDRNEMCKPEHWNNPFQASYNYGFAMAKHFGPTFGNGLATAIEVGNEPWTYHTPEFYRTILKGMASGIKDADPNLTVLPCALQSSDPHAEQSDFKNYAGLRLTAEEAPLIDAYNGHYYSYLTTPEGKQIGTYPEHPMSSMRGVLNDLRFCAQNLPGKDIYVTEWGWDSEGAGEDCTHSQCVSETAQAIYGIRGAMWFMRLGIKKLHWYFYANFKDPSMIYGRSGLTGSILTNFKPKRSFKAFEALRFHVGDKKFLSVIHENSKEYAYLLGDTIGKPTHIIAWLPVAAENKAKRMVNIPLPPGGYRVNGTWLLDGKNNRGTIIGQPVKSIQGINVALTAIPTLIRITK
jgi:hypothetical protein